MAWLLTWFIFRQSTLISYYTEAFVELEVGCTAFENTVEKGYKQQQYPEQNQVTFGMRSMGGSYSDKTGASSQIITPMNHRPRLAEVARALMAAKAAGELPQASNKDLELQESYR